MKSIAMIPLRSGSKRVSNKNLRLIKGRPLVYYIVKSVVDSGAFSLDSIFINSSDIIFKDIADFFGVNFYQRPESLSTDGATNDDFLYDFCSTYHCDYIFQFLATSPLVKSSTICSFVDQALGSNLDALISVKNIQIECVHDGKAINFVPSKQTPPSQELIPVQAYACGLMAWNTNKLVENYNLNKTSYHANFNNVDFFQLSTIESLDVDTPEDLFIAEAVMNAQHKDFYLTDIASDPVPYSSTSLQSKYEVYVPDILENDGVAFFEATNQNALIVNLDSLAISSKPGLQRLIHTRSNSACLITQKKGEGNRLHYHPDWDEWWYITRGTWDFYIEGVTHSVSKGDLICIPHNRIHKITATDDNLSSRLAVSRQDVIHAYPSI